MSLLRTSCLLLTLLFAGCGSVDPEPDYAATSNALERAGGERYEWRPDLADSIAARVAEWTSGGLDEDEAVKVALLNDTDLHAALLDVGIAKADVVQAGLWTNPRIGVSLRIPVDGGASIVDGALSQSLADFWQLPIRERAAMRRLERRILDVAHRMAGAIRDVRVAFTAAAAAEAEWAATAEAERLAGVVADTIAERERLGSGLASDTAAMRAAAADASIETIAARIRAAEARAELLRRLGLSSSPPELTLVASPQFVPEQHSVDELVASALESRLDLAAARAEEATAAAAVAVEEAAAFRIIDLGPSFELDDGSDRVGPQVGFELPIFDQNQAGIARARMQLRQAVERRDGLERAIRRDVATLVERRELASQLEQNYVARVLPERRRALELARESSALGRSSVLVVLDAQRGLARAELGVIEARRAHAVAVIELERAVAQRLPTTSERRPRSP